MVNHKALEERVARLDVIQHLQSNGKEYLLENFVRAFFTGLAAYDEIRLEIENGSPEVITSVFDSFVKDYEEMCLSYLAGLRTGAKPDYNSEKILRKHMDHSISLLRKDAKDTAGAVFFPLFIAYDVAGGDGVLGRLPLLNKYLPLMDRLLGDNNNTTNSVSLGGVARPPYKWLGELNIRRGEIIDRAKSLSVQFNRFSDYISALQEEGVLKDVRRRFTYFLVDDAFLGDVLFKMMAEEPEKLVRDVSEVFGKKDYLFDVNGKKLSLTALFNNVIGDMQKGDSKGYALLSNARRASLLEEPLIRHYLAPAIFKRNAEEALKGAGQAVSEKFSDFLYLRGGHSDYTVG